VILLNNNLQNTYDVVGTSVKYNNNCFSKTHLEQQWMENYYCHLNCRKDGPLDKYYSVGLESDGRKP
jgi:hypothetical protein